MADTIITPYATAMPYVKGALNTWISDEYDRQRLASYDLYDDLFSNSPTMQTLMMRGTNEDPKLVPTAKILINTLARYVGRGWGYSVSLPPTDPAAATATLAEILTNNQAAVQAMDDFFRRENLVSAFKAGVKEWLRRGDWVWYISADEAKEAGSRISCRPIDPRTYFPIMDDEQDLDRITGASIVEQVPIGEEVGVKVQRWLKPSSPSYKGDGTSITYECIVYELDGWDSEDDQTVFQVQTPMVSLTGITQLPLYHIPNNQETGNPFGVSDLRGTESLLVGINQSVSDEDEALAMAGMGMYATDSGQPVDEQGRKTGWILGAKRVIQLAVGTTFKRIDGITSVEPSQTHIKYQESRAQNSMGLNEVSMGQDTGNISGVALALKLSPTFDEADSKDDILNGIMTQLLHGLGEWFSVYESIDLSGVVFTSTTDPSLRMPFDRDGRFQELVELRAAGIISDEFMKEELRSKFGYKIPLDDAAEAGDPDADRVDSELNADA
jgi:hypothetical protein